MFNFTKKKLHDDNSKPERAQNYHIHKESERVLIAI